MPIRWKDHPNNTPLVAPTPGQHNDRIRTERLGRSQNEIEELRQAGMLVEKMSKSIVSGETNQ